MLNGTLLGLIGSLTVLLASIILAFLGGKIKRESGKNSLSTITRVLFISSLVGTVAVALIGGIQSQSTASSKASSAGFISVEQKDFSPQEKVEVAALLLRIEANPKDYDAREKLGYLYLSARDYSSAFENIRPVLMEDTNRVDALAQIGMILFAAQEIESSLQHLDKALNINPNHLEALYYKGLVTFMGRQDAAGAKVIWSKYKSLASEDHFAWEKVRRLSGMLNR